jgi:hypothetical protein
MGKFDFLNDMGESKKNYHIIKTSKSFDDKIKYIEILQNRNLIQEKFKNELISLYLNKKISDFDFDQNIQKSIRIHEKAELKIISIDEDMFKLKNEQKEYVGAIDRIPDNKSNNLLEYGKVSYLFVKELFNDLKLKTLTLKEINNLSDSLGFSLLKVFNVEQTHFPKG